MQAYEILLLIGGGIVLLVLLLAARNAVHFYRYEQFVCPTCSYPFRPRLRKYLFAPKRGRRKNSHLSQLWGKGMHGAPKAGRFQ